MTCSASCIRMRGTVSRSRRKSWACCRYRSSRFLCCKTLPITITKVSPCATTRSRAWSPLGTKKFFILRNHGLLTCGRSVAEAFQLMYTFESACAIQVRAQAGGGELIPIGQGIIDTAMEQARAVSNGQGPEKLVWPGLLRRLDRIDPS